MAKKKSYKFELIRIREFDAWDVAFHLMTGIPLEQGKESDYSGSLPTSLDSMKIWELCEKKKAAGPFSVGVGKLRCADAITNVRFPKKAEWRSINKAAEICLNVHEAISDTDSKPLYNTFIKEHIIDKDLKSLCRKFIQKHIKSQKEYNEYIETKSNLESSIIENEKNDNTFDINKQRKKVVDQKQKLRKTGNERTNAYHELLKTFLKKQKEQKSINGSGYRIQLRELLYAKGITINTSVGEMHYVVYKRSASKAKTGSCLFIWEELKKDMMDWTWFDKGFEPNNECDLTSIRAYEALSLSSIENIVHIKPINILLIKSIRSEAIKGNLKILTQITSNNETTYKLLDEEQYKKKKNCEEVPEKTNIIWDGQALVDKSVFDEAGYKEDKGVDNRHGMMLLRNRFFKACAFNTNISEYYNENGIEYVKDMFGRKKKAKNIKMIVTPDSIKYLKFADALFGSEAKEKNKDCIKLAYDFWKKGILPKNKTSSEFGVVKVEKASNLGNGAYHEIGYQVLNTLPLDEKDMESILKKEIEYINLLRNNPNVMLHRLHNVDVSVRKRYFIYTMMKHVEGFIRTKYYSQFRNDEIQDYKDRLIKGRIKVEGDFYVLCSMPMEMLEFSAHRNRKKISPPYLEPGQVYIAGEEENADVTLVRYPHMNSGSVCSLKNKNITKLEEYFNFENKDGCNIVVVSPWESNIMVKLGGADFDSDSALYIKDKTIQRAAKRLKDITALNPQKDGLPVAQLDEELKGGTVNTYSYNAAGMAKLDNELSKSSIEIGKISNYAQLFNSNFWDEWFKNKPRKRYLKKVYDCILELSVLNELVIDSAKKNITINISRQRGKICETEFYRKPVLQHEKRGVQESSEPMEGNDDKNTYSITVYPYFMTQVKDLSSAKRDRLLRNEGKDDSKYWNCPMDQIPKILNDKETLPNAEKTTKIASLDDLLEQAIKDTKEKPNNEQLKEINEKILDTIKQLDYLSSLSGAEENEITEDRLRIQNECIESVAKKTITVATMTRLFKYTFQRYKTSKKGKKGKYRYPEIAAPKIKYRYLGFLFAIGDEMWMNGEQNIALQCFNASEYERRDLISEEEYNDLTEEEKTKWESINIWGDQFYSFLG